jgi:hypothetical protein
MKTQVWRSIWDDLDDLPVIQVTEPGEGYSGKSVKYWLKTKLSAKIQPTKFLYGL